MQGSKAVVVALVTALALGTGFAADAELDPRVEALLRDIQGLRADFVQEVRDETGRLIESSDGRFAMQAPDRFRWHYEVPYEQLIVADGDRVWLYDVDLEQVTVRDQGEAAASSPLYVLTRPETLAERYVVTVPETAPGQDLIVLEPLAAGADFERVVLRFVADTLADIVIDDAFGQQTAIRFDDLEANPVLAAGTFEFTPPPGIDVLGMAELLGDESDAPGR